MSLRIALLFLAPIPAFSADPEKPVTLKDDELAVLSDPASPDRKELFDRLDGKLVKLEGRIQYASASPQAKFSRSYFYVDLKHVKHADLKTSRNVEIEWSKDPSTGAAQSAARKRSTDYFVNGSNASAYGRMPVLAIYGRFTDKGIVNASLDPKIAGVEYQPKKKEPAKLKK